MKFILSTFALTLLSFDVTNSFHGVVVPPTTKITAQQLLQHSYDIPTTTSPTCLFGTSSSSSSTTALEEAKTIDEQKQVITNMVEDEEWEKLGMELTTTIRAAISKNAKSATNEVKDFTKKIDDHVKQEITNIRNKADYELKDLTNSIDELSKSITKEITGKETYEAGDLSAELENSIKEQVSKFSDDVDGNLDFKELSARVEKRVKNKIDELVGEDEEYDFGKATKEIMSRRMEKVKEVLGEDFVEDAEEFGDATKNAIGKVGDMAENLADNLFGKTK